jgi:hypothetical protein
LKPSHDDFDRNFESGSPSAQTSEAKTTGASLERPRETHASRDRATSARRHAPDAREPSADARADAKDAGEEEIEVTEEMIEAGLTALQDHLIADSLTRQSKPAVVRKIYCAMYTVANPRRFSPSRHELQLPGS